MTEVVTDRDMGDETELSQESEKVIKWRKQWLKQAGYSRRNADLIASDTNIDLHFACDLIKKTEDEDLCMKILI